MAAHTIALSSERHSSSEMSDASQIDSLSLSARLSWGVSSRFEEPGDGLWPRQSVAQRLYRGNHPTHGLGTGKAKRRLISMMSRLVIDLPEFGE